MSKLQQEFIKLINQNQGIIYKVCRTYTQNTEDLEDLFQEIVLQLWKSYQSFRGESKFTTWMYRVALNTAITIFKKNEKKIINVELDTVHFKFQEDNSYQEKDEKITQLYVAIQQLGDIERALILLYLEDLPYKDISESLGITEVNARVKMNRAKAKLKEIITKV